MVTLSLRRRDLAWTTALIVLLSAVWVARGDLAGAGGTPPGEGIAVVYVAVATGFPDALGVGPGAGVDGAPIIILPTSPPIPPASAAELVRLDPRSVVIVGGTGVISLPMQNALASLLPNATISRIAGADRYQTNAMFSAATFPIEGWASIPASAFHGAYPANDLVASTSSFAYNMDGGMVLAPIQLPHGAHILELEAVTYDVRPASNVRVRLYLLTDGGGETILAEVQSPGPNTGIEVLSDATILDGLEVVNNELYSYFARVDYAFGHLYPTELTYVIKVRVRYRLGASSG